MPEDIRPLLSPLNRHKETNSLKGFEKLSVNGIAFSPNGHKKAGQARLYMNELTIVYSLLVSILNAMYRIKKGLTIPKKVVQPNKPSKPLQITDFV